MESGSQCNVCTCLALKTENEKSTLFQLVVTEIHTILHLHFFKILQTV